MQLYVVRQEDLGILAVYDSERAAQEYIAMAVIDAYESNDPWEECDAWATVRRESHEIVAITAQPE